MTTIVDDPHIQYELPEKESCKQKNPFHDRLKTSFPDFNSPSVFRVQSTPLTTAKPFKWSVEEMAVLQPVDIEELTNQEVVDNSYFLTPRRAEASTKFFSGVHSIPSLMSPCSSSRSTCVTSRAVSNQTLSTETPNAYSFSQPPEMLSSPTPNRDKSAAPDGDVRSPQVSSLPNKSRDVIVPSPHCPPPGGETQPSKEAGVDVGVQTMLTLPSEFDLERALGRYAFYQGEEMANNSLRRILFHSSPQRAHPSKERPPSPATLPRNSVSTPRKTSHKTDPHETPRTSKHHRSHSKSILKSRLMKRHPVSSLNTSSTPSSFLLSLMSGKLECSNLPTPISAAPFLSPILSHTDPDLSRLELDKLPGDITPPRNSCVYEECPSPLLQEINPAQMSPLTSFNPAIPGANTSPTVYKSTSTPFIHPDPKASQARRLLPPTLSPPQDTPHIEYPAFCQEEIVMQEDPGPPTSPVTFSHVPDRLLATQSLECDSGIGSSYGEHSSLMQSQSRSRAKPASGEHQLSFSFCPDKPPNKSLHQGPSLPGEKPRSKRGCLKGDGSLLSIVHCAQPTPTNESKRYQPDSTLHESFSDSSPSASSLREAESESADPS